MAVYLPATWRKFGEDTIVDWHGVKKYIYINSIWLTWISLEQTYRCMLKAFDRDVLYDISRSSQNVNFKATFMAEAASRDVLFLVKEGMSDRNHH